MVYSECRVVSAAGTAGQVDLRFCGCDHDMRTKHVQNNTNCINQNTSDLEALKAQRFNSCTQHFTPRTSDFLWGFKVPKQGTVTQRHILADVRLLRCNLSTTRVWVLSALSLHSRCAASWDSAGAWRLAFRWSSHANVAVSQTAGTFSLKHTMDKQDILDH